MSPPINKVRSIGVIFFVSCLGAGFSCENKSGSPQPIKGDPVETGDAVNGKQDKAEETAVLNYVLLRQRVWKTRAVDDYKALFPKPVSIAIESNKKHVKEFIEKGLLNIEGCALGEKVSVEEAGVGDSIHKVLKDSGDFELYRANISIAGGGRNEVLLALIGGRLFQLGNY